MTSTSLLRTLGLTVLLSAGAASAVAGIISVSGNGSIVAPPSAVLNNTVTNTLQWGFNERQGVLLGSALAVDGGTIAAGTRVDSHMIFLNKAGSGSLTTLATWTFSGTILGVMSDVGGTLEALSTALLGAPGTTYPASGFNNRGLENNDGYQVLAGGLKLEVDMGVSQPGDWIRVVTVSVPDAGSSALLLGLGLAAVVGLARRRR